MTLLASTRIDFDKYVMIPCLCCCVCAAVWCAAVSVWCAVSVYHVCVCVLLYLFVLLYLSALLSLCAVVFVH